MSEDREERKRRKEGERNRRSPTSRPAKPHKRHRSQDHASSSSSSSNPKRRKNLPAPPQLKAGSVVNDTYTLLQMIAKGRQAQVFLAESPNHQTKVALKLVTNESAYKIVAMEAKVLEELKDSGKAPVILDKGIVTVEGQETEAEFIVMELMGKDLSTLLGSKLPLIRVGLLAVKMLQSIEALHKIGYIHRDIKPENFTFQNGEEKMENIRLIDFGLAKKFEANEEEPPKSKFRGVRKYCSLNGHNGLELAPRDDLFSLWLTILELSLGKLPWTDEDSSESVQKKKVEFIKSFKSDLSVPQPLKDFLLEIESLKFNDVPNYSRLLEILTCLIGYSSQQSKARIQTPENPKPATMKIQPTTVYCRNLRKLHSRVLANPGIVPAAGWSSYHRDDDFDLE